MLRIIIFIILILHGLIHLMGFLYEWKVMAIKNFSGRMLLKSGQSIRKLLGLIWLLVAAIFVFASLLFILRHAYWWMWAAVAVCSSQLMVVLNWKDARAGTVLNVILAVVVLVAWGNWKLNYQVEQEAQEIFARNPAPEYGMLTTEHYRNLPLPVQRWLEKSNVAGKELIRTVRLKQKGEMNIKKGGKWMPFEAEQYYSVQRPAFVWKARIDAGFGFFISGRDLYNKGHGNMKIQALSVFTVSNSSGAELDQGTLLRYLAEICWFPSGATSSYISWMAIDSLSARASMSYRNTSASGVFTFTPEGDVSSFEALRYGEFDGRMTQERWHVDCGNYREFQGIRIPTVSEVTWKLKDGDWRWLKLEVTEAEYNTTRLYPGE